MPVFLPTQITLLAVASPSEELADSTRSSLDGLVEAMPRLLLAAVIFAVGYGASRAFRFVLRAWMRRNHPPSFSTVMSKLGGWVVLALTLLTAVTIVLPSVQPVDMLAGLGFFSIAIGFAFQDILENILSGVLLLLRQPFRSGDQIEVVGQSGTVEAITIRETRLKTFSGELIVIPNRDVYKGVIRVLTHFEQRRQSFVVGVAYENDAQEACSVIEEALRSVQGVATSPACEAYIAELGVSTVNIDARFWGDPAQHESRVVLDRAIKAVKLALDAAGIEMPADIVALQATPSLRAAIHGDREVTPGGGVAP